MTCPVCGERLRAVEKFGVEVDICPGCKGVWLDRGELEKILDYQEGGGPSQVESREYVPEAPRREEHRREAYRAERPTREYEHDHEHEHHYEREYHDKHRDMTQGHKKSRGSWLSDLLGGLGEE